MKEEVKLFGSDTYIKNLEEMKRNGCRPCTTQESISIASQYFNIFGLPKKEHLFFGTELLELNGPSLQIGCALITPERGIFTNVDPYKTYIERYYVSKTKRLSFEEYEDMDHKVRGRFFDGEKVDVEYDRSPLKALEKLLDNAEQINGVWFVNNKTAFAPDAVPESSLYKSHKGTELYLKPKDFARSTFARSLEHGKGKEAKRLKKIPRPYFGGFSKYKPVFVNGFFDDRREGKPMVIKLNHTESDFETPGQGFMNLSSIRSYWSGLRVGYTHSDDKEGYALGISEE